MKKSKIEVLTKIEIPSKTESPAKINVIYENDDFLVINKPPSLSFHTEKNQIGIIPQLEINHQIKLWSVHRLDKITSGLLLAAKNKVAATELNQLFLDKQINKTYLAISDKKPKKKQGAIIGDMQKSRNGSWRLLKSKTNPAVTQFLSHSLLPGKRLFVIKPRTGKTHQIRVALKSLGSPILGDERYKGTAADRGYLHAYQLKFIWKKQEIVITAIPEFGKCFLAAEFFQKLKELTLS